MNRAAAIAEIVRVAERPCVFYNMQRHALHAPRPITSDCFALTAAMGLGGGQTPVIAWVYD